MHSLDTINSFQCECPAGFASLFHLTLIYMLLNQVMVLFIIILNNV